VLSHLTSRLRYLREPGYLALVTSNTLTSLGSLTQILLHGWLTVQWGHNALFLLAFAAARVLPKLLLTLPAGIACDRLPRPRVLAATRMLSAVASLAPLLTFIYPAPLAWLLLGASLAGTAFAFEVPAGRSVLGDTVEKPHLYRVLAVNNGGGHIAAIIGPLVAVLLGPAGLAVSASLLAAAAVLTLRLPARPRAEAVVKRSPSNTRAELRELLRYVVSAPAVAVLVLLSTGPATIDRGVALLVPSLASNSGMMSLALLAPEIGSLLAALSLTIAPVRLGFRATVGILPGYALMMGLALGFSHIPAVLICGLLLAGMARLAFSTNSQVCVQEAVPPNMRGRVLAF
jgi:MFS family permease